jgi:UDP-glucose 4-epimerase
MSSWARHVLRGGETDRADRRRRQDVPTTYLVTGGAGFIGSHLTEALLERGDQVTVLDDLSTGRLNNLRNVRLHPGLRVEIGSVLDELRVDELVHRCDVVVHLAAAVGVRLIIDEPLRSFTTNIHGSEIVIGAAHRYRSKILVASTSEIYGKNGSSKLVETADRLLGTTSASRWAYSTAKAVDEILALTYHRERNLDAVIARLFNTVGPRQSPSYGMVIPRLVRQALAGDPLTVYGDGRQSRCFCHVDDVVRCLLGLLESSDAIGEVFNVGSSEEVSILELANRIGERANSRSRIELIPYDQAFKEGFEDMQRRVPDTTKVENLIGWRPTRCLDEIVDDALADAAAEMEEEARLSAAAGEVDLVAEERAAAYVRGGGNPIWARSFRP